MFGLKNILTKGFWNGHKVEFGKIYGNPAINAFKPLQEAEGKKKLRVFDFDDTLVKTNSHIYIKHGDGKESKLTPGEYAVYEPKKDDKFDFSDFEKVTEPHEIKGVTKLLRRLTTAEGERNISILTARAAYKPVKDYLKDIGLEGIYVAALASADPQHKADWIEDKIKQGYNDVFFIDDSHKNVSAVNKLKEKYPNIKLKVQHVKHETAKAPGNSFKHDTVDDKTKTDINKLSSMIPKADLNKKVKNPETGNMIKLKTALGYDQTSNVYKVAQQMLKK